jgi:hypothetical protein
MCAALVAAGACATSCLSHEVEVAPIEVKPIHVTVDVNVRVQRELDEFFDYEQRPGETGAPQQQQQEPETKEGKR